MLLTFLWERKGQEQWACEGMEVHLQFAGLVWEGGEAGQGCAGCSEAQITCASEKVPAITSAAELD